MGLDEVWQEHMHAGEAALRAGRYAEAEKEFEAALESIPVPDGEETLSILIGLAMVHGLGKRYAEEEAVRRRMLAIQQSLYGPEAPEIPQQLGLIAWTYHFRGMFGHAVELLERAAAVVERQRGPEHPALLTYLNQLADDCASAGDIARSEVLHQRIRKVSGTSRS